MQSDEIVLSVSWLSGSGNYLEMASAVLFTAQGTKYVSDQDVLGSYMGPVNDSGLRAGQGVYTFPNSFFQYHGEYVLGQREGETSLVVYTSDGC